MDLNSGKSFKRSISEHFKIKSDVIILYCAWRTEESWNCKDIDKGVKMSYLREDVARLSNVPLYSEHAPNTVCSVHVTRILS